MVFLPSAFARRGELDLERGDFDSEPNESRISLRLFIESLFSLDAWFLMPCIEASLNH